MRPVSKRIKPTMHDFCREVEDGGAGVDDCGSCDADVSYLTGLMTTINHLKVVQDA